MPALALSKVQGLAHPLALSTPPPPSTQSEVLTIEVQAG